MRFRDELQSQRRDRYHPPHARRGYRCSLWTAGGTRDRSHVVRLGSKVSAAAGARSGCKRVKPCLLSLSGLLSLCAARCWWDVTAHPASTGISAPVRIQHDNAPVPSPKPTVTQREAAARVNMQLGLGYLQQGNLAIAKEKLERARDIDPHIARPSRRVRVARSAPGQGQGGRQGISHCAATCSRTILRC